MTLTEARAKVRVAISRLEQCSDRHLVADTIQEAHDALGYIKPGRLSESVAVQDLQHIASRLNWLADKIAGVRGRINA